MNSTKKYANLILERREKLLIVKFNIPQKKNALNRDTYLAMTELLQDAATDETITVLAITGVGDFYSSGNDLSKSVALQSGLIDFDAFLLQNKIMISNFLRAFVDYPKLLVAVVNGPCFGVAATSAALCDIVYCSDTAYFQTPFTKLGICAEGASSYTFPKILGKSKAMEMLVCDHRMSAEEALKFNFVSEIFKVNDIEMIWTKLIKFSRLPPGSMRATKDLVKKVDKDIIDKVLLDEAETLHQRWYTEEFFNAIQSFLTDKKSKL